MSTGPSPHECPTCGTDVPAGALRCPQCGRVFGEANRCPHCHAIAAVRPRRGGFVCVACGKPREPGPGTTVFDGRAARPADDWSAAGPGSAGRMQRIAATLLVAGAAAAGLASLAPGAPLALLAAVAVSLGVVGMATWSRARRTERAAARRRLRLEQAVLSLAERRGGELRATDVARELAIGLQDADALLTSMSDGTRVTVEVDGDGIVHYVFRELAARAPKVRVAPGEAEAAADVVEAEAAARVEAESARRGRL